ncbi:unnamed protein product [Prorocentrum cordatum]|nr:unnamed protein product [Polarella glacialis]
MAYGDPHMQNILGQRFDLMQPGSHTLVLIPRLAPERESELLRVQAGVQRIGRACADMYITTLNVTGRWAEARRRPHGLHFNAAEPADRRGTNWMHFGSSLGHLDLKVVYGQTPTGTRYLNFFVRRLGQVGCRVGGLLGEDDHTAATMPDSQCKNILVLLEGIPADRGEPARSAAGASLL